MMTHTIKVNHVRVYVAVAVGTTHLVPVGFWFNFSVIARPGACLQDLDDGADRQVAGPLATGLGPLVVHHASCSFQCNMLLMRPLAMVRTIYLIRALYGAWKPCRGFAGSGSKFEWESELHTAVVYSIGAGTV